MGMAEGNRDYAGAVTFKRRGSKGSGGNGEGEREQKMRRTEVRRFRRDYCELLENNLVVFFQAAENLGTGAVGDSDLDRHFLLAVLATRIGDLD